jgi:predicted GNAT superfamily acetyltransferase
VEADRHRSRNGTLPLLSPFSRDGDEMFEPAERRPDSLLIEIPSDILAITLRSLQTARQWRLAVRDHFRWALSAGYEVESVRRDAATEREFYVVTHRSPAA